MKSLVKRQSIIFPLFVLALSLITFSTTSAQVNPVPSPTPPLPPATNPAAKPADTSSIHFNPPPAANQPPPATITPAPQPFPKAAEDTVFRSLDVPPPGQFQKDSTEKPKK